MIQILDSGHQVDNGPVCWRQRLKPQRVTTAEMHAYLDRALELGRQSSPVDGWLTWCSHTHTVLGHEVAMWWRIRWESDTRLDVDIPAYGYSLTAGPAWPELNTPATHPAPSRHVCQPSA